MKTITLVVSILLGYCIIQLIILLLFFHFHNLPEKETREMRELRERMEMEGVKITFTKGRLDIEYDGCIARFGGELCVDGFYAYANSLTWIKWNHCKGHAQEEDRIRIMRKAQEYEGKYCKFVFLDDNDNELNLRE